MKLVTYDLADASSGRYIMLDHTLGQMGFKRILATVWVGDTTATVGEIRSRLKLLSTDKVIVVELHRQASLSEANVLAPRPFGAFGPALTAGDLLGTR